MTCSIKTNDSLIKVEENGKSATITNKTNETYTKHRVDNCLIVQKTACDYVISKEEIGDVAIELKGCNVDHAIFQIEQTFHYWKSNALCSGDLGGLIVCSRFPKVATTVQRKQLSIKKQYNAPIHIVTKNQHYSFEKLLSFKGPL